VVARLVSVLEHFGEASRQQQLIRRLCIWLLRSTSIGLWGWTGRRSCIRRGWRENAHLFFRHHIRCRGRFEDAKSVSDHPEKLPEIYLAAAIAMRKRLRLERKINASIPAYLFSAVSSVSRASARKREGHNPRTAISPFSSLRRLVGYSPM